VTPIDRANAHKKKSPAIVELFDFTMKVADEIYADPRRNKAA
jgi:hypothetical protein